MMSDALSFNDSIIAPPNLQISIHWNASVSPLSTSPIVKKTAQDDKLSQDNQKSSDFFSSIYKRISYLKKFSSKLLNFTEYGKNSFPAFKLFQITQRILVIGHSLEQDSPSHEDHIEDVASLALFLEKDPISSKPFCSCFDPSRIVHSYLESLGEMCWLPPPVSSLLELVEAMTGWLKIHSSNVVVLVCKDGIYRSGLFKTIQDSFSFFIARRYPSSSISTPDSMGFKPSPSFQRALKYSEDVISKQKDRNFPKKRSRNLKQIIVNTVPHISTDAINSGLAIYCEDKLLYNSVLLTIDSKLSPASQDSIFPISVKMDGSDAFEDFVNSTLTISSNDNDPAWSSIYFTSTPFSSSNNYDEVLLQDSNHIIFNFLDYLTLSGDIYVRLFHIPDEQVNESNISPRTSSLTICSLYFHTDWIDSDLMRFPLQEIDMKECEINQDFSIDFILEPLLGDPTSLNLSNEPTLSVLEKELQSLSKMIGVVPDPFYLDSLIRQSLPRTIGILSLKIFSNNLFLAHEFAFDFFANNKESFPNEGTLSDEYNRSSSKVSKHDESPDDVNTLHYFDESSSSVNALENNRTISCQDVKTGYVLLTDADLKSIEKEDRESLISSNMAQNIPVDHGLIHSNSISIDMIDSDSVALKMKPYDSSILAKSTLNENRCSPIPPPPALPSFLNKKKVTNSTLIPSSSSLLETKLPPPPPIPKQLNRSIGDLAISQSDQRRGKEDNRRVSKSYLDWKGMTGTEIKGTIWEEIGNLHLDSLIDKKSFESLIVILILELFCIDPEQLEGKGLARYSTSEMDLTRINSSSVLSLIEIRRANNIAIGCSMLYKKFQNEEMLLIELYKNSPKVTLDDLLALKPLLPTPEEKSIFQLAARMKKSGFVSPAESFMFAMSIAPAINWIIETLIIQRQFDSEYAEIASSLSVLGNCMLSLKTSLVLKKLLKIILSSCQLATIEFGRSKSQKEQILKRGMTEGFRLSTLDRLSSFKSEDGHKTLIHFITELLDHQSIKEIKKICDEIAETRGIDVSLLKGSMEELNMNIEKIKRGPDLEQQEERIEKFIYEISDWVSQKIQELKSLALEFEIYDKVWKSVSAYFGVEEQSEGHNLTSETFLRTWDNFFKELIEVYSKTRRVKKFQ